MSLAIAVEEPEADLLERRCERLRMALFGVPDLLPGVLREMPRRLQNCVAGAARTPLPVLLRATDVRRYLLRVDELSLLLAFGDGLGVEALAAVRSALGASADDPSEEELRRALDEVSDRFEPRVLTVVLACGAAAEVRAAALCDVVLDSDPRFCVGPVDPAAFARPKALEAPASVVRPASGTARTRRPRRPTARSVAVPAVARAKRRRRPVAPAPSARTVCAHDADVVQEVTPSRRRTPLTPLEERRFDADHPLVGSMVIAEVWYDGVDPADPGCVSKRRPCVVVAVSLTSLLVRPGYSAGGLKTRTWKSVELQDWEAAGLRCPTWIEVKARRISRSRDLHALGRLSDEDWNSLF